MMGPNVDLQRRAIPLEAPHLVDLVLRQEPEQSNPVKTTVDLEIQHSLEYILRSHKNRLSAIGIHQAGAMVVAARSGDVLGMVGSLSYSDTNQGYNNAVLASRSAGSALKPFLYALALEKGGSTFSEIADTFRSYPTPRGDYLPLNADRRWYGPVTIRLALGNSLNMPAVKTLRSLGVNEVLRVAGRSRGNQRNLEVSTALWTGLGHRQRRREFVSPGAGLHHLGPGRAVQSFETHSRQKG